MQQALAKATNEYSVLHEDGLPDALECLCECLAEVEDDHGAAAAARSEASLLWSQDARGSRSVTKIRSMV